MAKQDGRKRGSGANGEQLREEYLDMLLQRISEARYPSKELLDRAEALAYTREHAEMLVQYLIQAVETSKYPSHQLLDRIERILFGISGRVVAHY